MGEYFLGAIEQNPGTICPLAFVTKFWFIALVRIAFRLRGYYSRDPQGLHPDSTPRFDEFQTVKSKPVRLI